jgi:hypothetical protein
MVALAYRPRTPSAAQQQASRNAAFTRQHPGRIRDAFASSKRSSTFSVSLGLEFWSFSGAWILILGASHRPFIPSQPPIFHFHGRKSYRGG